MGLPILLTTKFSKAWLFALLLGVHTEFTAQIKVYVSTRLALQ